MTLQTLKLGNQEFVVLARRDFDRLAAEASKQRADDYWTTVALAAEADAKAKKENPIPFDEVERELNGYKRTRAKRGQAR